MKSKTIIGRAAALLSALAFVASTAVAQPPSFGYKSWKPPVANLAALPATGNTIGDARITLDDFSVYVWDGNSWETKASGGGSGTVTSIALAVPTEWTVSGSPVTTAGTITIAEATQAANTVYAGPTTGAAAAPGFRALVSADIPANAADTSGNAATATALAANPNDCTGTDKATAIAANGNLTCSADLDTDDQTATEVPYTPTTGTDWADPDPTHAGGALDALAARLTTEEGKADDDTPESGDFGAAADLESDGSLSADVVAAAEMADADHGDVSWLNGVAAVDSGAVGLTEIADDAGCTASQDVRRNAADTAYECYTPAAGGSGDVVGPASSTDFGVPYFDDTTGKLLGSSAATLTAAGSLTIPSGQTVDVPVGTGTAPSIRFSTDTNTGISQSNGGDTIGFTTNGLPRLYAFDTHVAISQALYIRTQGDVTTQPNSIALWTNAVGQLTIMNPTSYNPVFGGTVAGVRMGTVVEANTAGSGAPNVIVANESGTCWTNSGATALNVHTAPTAASGIRLCYIVEDADGIRVNAAAGDILHIPGDASTAGGYCESTTVDDSITWVSTNATDWRTVALVGVGWSCDGP